MNVPLDFVLARRTALAACLITTCLALLGPAAPAATAEAHWSVTSVHGPQNMPPGGKGGYALQIANVGETESDGTPVLVTDKLPPGVSVGSLADIRSDISNSGLWDCSATSFPATVVNCEYPQVVPAPGASSFFRGFAPPLEIAVDIAPNAVGDAGNEVTVSGGGAAEPTSILDSTHFDAATAGFGFAPGSFVADAFDSAVANGANPFGGSSERQAGSHPFELRVGFRTNLTLREDPDDTTVGDLFYTTPEEHAKTLETTLPAGMIGNPEALPHCSAALLYIGGLTNKGSCPTNTQVGTVDLDVNNGKQLPPLDEITDVPVYNMEPPFGAVAAFGFSYLSNTVWIIASLDPTDHYSVKAKISNAIELLPVRSARLALWGVPGDPAHDPLRMNPEDPEFGDTAMGSPFTADIRPFLTLPSACGDAGAIQLRMDSWQDPGAFTPEQRGAEIEVSGCDDPRLRFQPTIAVQPTTREADSPTGLSVDLRVPQKDDKATNVSQLYAGGGNDRALATPPLRSAKVTLPEGMSVNPSSADGLGACTAVEIGLGTDQPVGCPDSSKIGTVELETPLLPPGTAKGSVYLAKQLDNEFNSLLALYVVLENKDRDLLVKLPGHVEADERTGRLVTTFDDGPQIPFSSLHLELKSGPRAPLRTPDICGTFTTTSELTPWNGSLPAATPSDSFQIARGCAASKASRPFSPTLSAGTQIPTAGAFSPFVLKLSRPDASQELSGLTVTLPPGMIGKLAGITECTQAALDSAKARTALGAGALEAISPSCPVDSRVGKVIVGAGAGSSPFHVHGNAYLAGSYKGAPLSLAIVTPVLAGPFDLGAVVVQTALQVDTETAQITAVSDPIPRILQGIPLDLRSLDVTMDRPEFTLNPTSCNPMAVNATVLGAGGDLNNANDDVSVVLSNRFQVGACAALGFKPKLDLRLKGGTKRGAHPSLRAVLTTRKGDANIGRAEVTLPRSEFLENAHIRTVCTRVQFAANQCPAGSVYGYARAFTPLLEKPLRGPVYLRSNGGERPLPDLVAALRGQIDIDLRGRIDSVHGRIRSTFEVVPDAPVTKFILTMKGGKKGLLANSRNLCSSRYRAKVKLVGQNGRTYDTAPAVGNGCGKRLPRGS